ncbi:MAG: hypothetical protein JOZ75_01625 [Candidatus Dormibacteraeota bacterium]|nr:hypothetical protein [Candidatus Dormibacteraeota bacterium]
MPIFRRKTTPTVEPPYASGLRCQARGCSRYDAVACTYRDRRGRGCTAAFCADHSVVVDDGNYCRRHGGTMRALGARGKVKGGLPDVDNRGPSLVQHVANTLEPHIATALDAVARPHEQVIAEREVNKAFDPDRSSRWERAWRLVDGTGVVIKVAVFVEESRPDVVAVRVGSHIVFEEVPPWIASRQNPEPASEEQEEAARREFYRQLQVTIAQGVDRVRQTADHPAWAQ